MRRRLRGPWLLGGLLLALTGSSTGAQQPPPKPPEQPAPAPRPAEPKPAAKKDEKPARTEYLQALNTLAAGQGGSMEKVFTLGRAAAAEQLKAVLEWDEAFARGKVPRGRFERTLPGFHVGASEALYVVPNSLQFLELARQRGGDVDRRFFELLHQTFQGGATRVYVDHLTDVMGCYHLGSREFVSLYKGWTQFQASYPNAYKEPVKEEVQMLEQTLLTANCACSSREVVDAGFEAFLKMFPKSPIAPQARERLKKIHTNTSDIVFQCGQPLPLPQPIPPGKELPPGTDPMQAP